MVSGRHCCLSHVGQQELAECLAACSNKDSKGLAQLTWLAHLHRDQFAQTVSQLEVST